MPGSPSVRLIIRGELVHVAAVHLEAFPSSVLTKLGDDAVRRYYDWQLSGPHDCVALGGWTGDQLAGFVFGGTFDAALFGFLRRDRMFLMGRLLQRPRLLVDPELRPSIRTGLQSMVRRRARSVGPVVERPSSFGILSIAVRPSAQGSGVAQQLLAETEQAARARGFEHMNLTVDPENGRAIRFYERNGWIRDHPHGAAWSGTMRKALPAV